MANTKTQEIPLTFEKGLVAEIEESVLDTGQAAQLVNWEPATYGGLRVRNAYSSISTTGLVNPYKVRGFGAIATGTAVAGAVTAPVVVQKEVWPNSDADPLATKTLTLNGVSIGNICVAVVSEDSGETPTVTAGWTQRGIAGSAQQNYVKFYTKTANTSTEPFAYTITSTRIRAVTLYEVKYMDAEDPGTKWAAVTQLSGGGGSDTLTVNAVDADGGLALTGYLHDGGTPATSHSGTSGYASATLDNQNTRTGVTFQDLDQLDGKTETSNVTDVVYTTPSWTPPTTGIIILLYLASGNSGPNVTGCSVTGNGLTWHDCYDAGELGEFSGAVGGSAQGGYAWADCAQIAPQAGAITVTVTGTASAMDSLGCSFMLAVGADTIDPFVQQVTHNSGTPTAFAAALQENSGVVGIGLHDFNDPGLDQKALPTIDADDWQAEVDYMQVNNPAGGFHFTTAYIHSSYPPHADITYGWTAVVSSLNFSYMNYEIRGQGTAARSYHGGMTGAGTVVEGYNYNANKRITAKMVVWGYTPPSVSADTVDFYIVMALAQGSTTYKIYRIPRDEITSGTWEQIDTITDAENNEAFVSFAQGAGNLIWSASSMNYPRAIELATLSTSNITDMFGLTGRTVAYHKDRLFMAGSTQNPSRLYFSQIGEPTNFVTATDFLDIGGDDGEAIQDLSSVEGLLLVPKTNRAYLISGSGVESFFVNELAGGTAAPGRSAIRTPYGTLLAGTDDVWVVQGGGVDPMSRPLGGGYTVTGTVSTSYAQDMALVCDTGSGTVWRVNLVTGAWSHETTSGNAGLEGVYITFSLNGRLYYGTNGSTTQVGGTRRLTSDRTYDQTTSAIDFHAATGRMAMFGPQVRYTPRHLFLQLRTHGGDNTLFVTVETNIGSKDFSYLVTEDTQREYESVGWAKGVEWMKFTFACDSSPEFGAIDVEKAVLTVSTEDY